MKDSLDRLIMQGVDEDVARQLCHPDNNNNRVTVTASNTTSVTASTSGRVTKIGAGAVARLAIALGAGR